MNCNFLGDDDAIICNNENIEKSLVKEKGLNRYKFHIIKCKSQLHYLLNLSKYIILIIMLEFFHCIA